MLTLSERRPLERTDMGCFSVEIELANNFDVMDAERGRIKPEKVRRLQVSARVDSGATRLVLPRKVVEQLGLPLGEKVRVWYADKRHGVRHTVSNVWLKMLKRSDVFTALVEPKRDTARISAIVLETLDLLVDCVAQKVAPRDPKIIVAEIE